MASCEKCWREAGGSAERYAELIKINGCSPEEQAGGVDAKHCPKCKKKTVHVYVQRCMNPDCVYNPEEII